MSKTPPSPSTSPAGGLAPLDAAAADKAPGVFRLDTMAPGVDNAQQAMTAPKKTRVSVQAMTLAALLALGGGLIYAMRLLGIGPMTTLAKTSVPDYDLGHASAAADHKKIIEDLKADHAASQVPLEQVQKNPFRMSDLVQAPAPTGPNADELATKAGAERARLAAEGRRRKVETALAGLKLNGVLGGSKPVARISGEAVRVGDTVADLFTVRAIHGRSVELVCDDQTFTLQMDDEDANSLRPKKK
jgi:hypothetical protein